MEGFLNPKEVIGHLVLRPNMTVAEFGCGSGGFALALADRLPDGKVYAIDIQEEPLSVLRSRAGDARLSNIETIRGDLEAKEGSTLADACLDIVLIPNLLFQAEDKKGVMREAKRVLKEDGEMVVIDWLQGVPFGPGENAFGKEQAKKMGKSLGFIFEREFDAGRYHYGLIFIKQ